MGHERRRHPRGNPREEILAIFAPTPTLAKVKDMSEGGMRLEYISGPNPDNEWSRVNLFLTLSKAFLPGLPFRVVYDRLTDEGLPNNNFLKCHECGLEFGELSEPQSGQLHAIMNCLFDNGNLAGVHA